MLGVTQLSAIKAWDAPHGNAENTSSTASCQHAGRPTQRELTA